MKTKVIVPPPVEKSIVLTLSVTEAHILYRAINNEDAAKDHARVEGIIGYDNAYEVSVAVEDGVFQALREAGVELP